jgi:integrase
MPAEQTGSVFKRNGRWTVRYRDEHHRQRFASSSEWSKADAQKWLAAKIEEVAALRRGDRLPIAPRDVPTVGEVAIDFLKAYVANPRKTPATKEVMRARLRFLDPLANLRLNALTVADVEDWRNALTERKILKGQHRPLAPRTAWAVHKTLRQVLAYAHTRGLVTTNVAKAVENPSPPRREPQAFRSWADVELVVANLNGNRSKAIAVVTASTGLRPSELLALRWSDVDLEARRLYVRRVWRDGAFRPWGKTDESVREVPLGRRAVEALTVLQPDYVRFRPDELVFAGRANGKSSIRIEGGRGTTQPIDWARWRRNHWTKAAKAAGFEGVTPYALRRTYATIALHEGVPLYEVAKVMGNSPDVIAEHYGALATSALDRAAEAFDRAAETSVRSQNARQTDAG